MPNFDEAKRAAFSEIQNLTAALVEDKVAKVALLDTVKDEPSKQALRLALQGQVPEGSPELATLVERATNARMATMHAYQSVGTILKRHGFKGAELEQAGADIMYKANEAANQIAATQLGIELDDDGKPSRLPKDHTPRTPDDFTSGKTSSKANIGPKRAES